MKLKITSASSIASKVRISLSWNSVHYLQSQRNYCDESSKESDEEKKKQEKRENMKLLLQSFSKKQNVSSKASKLELSQPSAPKNIKEKDLNTEPLVDLKVQKAVKEVAKNLKGDPAEIESDLIESLKSHSSSSSLKELLFKMKVDHSKPTLKPQVNVPPALAQLHVKDETKKEIKVKEESPEVAETDLLGSLKSQSTSDRSLRELLFKMKVDHSEPTLKPQVNVPPALAQLHVKDETLKEFKGESPEVVQQDPSDDAEIDLLGSFESQSKIERNLSDLLVGMKIDRSEPAIGTEVNLRMDPRFKVPVPKNPPSRLHQLHRSENQLKRQFRPIDVNSGIALDIFPSNYKGEGPENTLQTWERLQKRELKLASRTYPRNGFEEMIQWTEQGKLWKFPIDNEYGLEDEKQNRFSDHLFLEVHLKDWCPEKGPIRHFMELVCTGLSKNPYITVTRKKAHIEWYKDYFESKRDVLEKVGAM